jgi:cellulose synthase/poly-beta-1,6-N-acetylglucosamine synthase-like glycosyltransferase
MIKVLFLLLVTFIGIYLNVWFLLIVLGNKSKIREKKKATKIPSISILIPAYNEAKTLARSLKSILKLDYPKNKLDTIVIDNGSTDGTLEVAKRFKKYGIKALRLPTRGKTKALNLGLKHAKGKLIGVLDADTFVSKGCLKNMIGYFNDKNVGAVTNHVRVASSCKLLPSIQDVEYIFSAFSKKLISLLGALYIIPGTLSLIRRNLVEKIGFSEDTITEDMDIALCMIKKDYKVVNAIDAVSYTEVPSTFKGLLKQRVRWYRGFIQNVRKHSDMIFNRKYPHLGCFILPFSSFFAIFVGVSLTIFLLFGMARNVFFFAKDVLYMPILEKIGMDIGRVSLVSFIAEPYSTITYATIILGSLIVLIISFKSLKMKIRKRLIVLPLYFFIYYNMIMLFWVISAFLEFVGWKKKW